MQMKHSGNKQSLAATMYLPTQSWVSIANGIRSYILTFSTNIKPIGYLIKYGTITHVDNISEALYQIHIRLSKLDYSMSLDFEETCIKYYSFTGIITNKNIHQFIPEVEPVDSSMPTEVIMTIVPGQEIQMGILYMNFSGHRTSEQNVHLAEHLKVEKNTNLKVKSFSSSHLKEIKISFKEKTIIDSYFSEIEFFTNDPSNFIRGLHSFKELINNIG